MIKNAAIKYKEKIFTGNSHYSILEKNKFLYDKDYIEGFITDKNIFVDRREAAKIAFDCKQIKIKINSLFSYNINF